ncbi:MAG: hypothetical protein P8Y13_16360 [Deinococcales bacterium]
MTIPLSPASDRRGPRETLLALTEAYLRRGALDADARRSVARLAGRVTTAGSHGPRPRSPGSLGPGAPAIPEWGPLACALAAMLRGEAEHALRVVNEALRAELVPEALRPALLGLGIRAALASDRPALAARWRAGLRFRMPGRPWRAGPGAGSEPEPASQPDDDVGWAAVQTAVPASSGGRDLRTKRRSRALAEEAVLASLPPDVRELLERAVGEGSMMEAVPRAVVAMDEQHGEADSGEADSGEPRAGDAGSAGAGSAGAGSGEGESGDVESGARESDGGDRQREARASATLHLVMDAYHGDVVSVPARVEVLSWRPSDALDEAGAEPDWEPSAGAGAALVGWNVEGLPLLTVRVAAGDALPTPPGAEGWHLRFVGRLRALDARTSDGSLLDLSWEDGGFTAILHPPDWLQELPDDPSIVATRVTHVVLVPESEVGDAEQGAAPGD